MFRLPVLRGAIAALFGTLALSPGSGRAQTFSVSNFTVDTVFTGAGTTALDFGPTGILYLAEKRGRVLALTPNGSGGFNAPQVFADFRTAVDTRIESGLLGLAVDPDFATNRYLYVFFSTTSDQRLVRYTANAAGTSGSSPTVLLSGLPQAATFHNAGDIHFRPGERGNLYVALGDDDRPAEAQSLTSYRGKMLRVNKTNGEGLSSNPYYTGGSLASVRGRTWAIGFRNPFRFTFHPTAGQPANDVLYVSENGDSTDKMAWVRAGSNGGWSPAGDGPFINPTDPNHRVMYSGAASHIGIAVAASGPFADGSTPVVYLSNWLSPSGGSIRRWRLTGTDLDTRQAIPADNGRPFVQGLFGTHLAFGPDGALYFTTSSVNASNSGYTAGRVRFVGGQPPRAAFSTSPAPAEGPAPLTVRFTDGSTDPDGMIRSHAWDFGDGNGSTRASPTHIYQTPGSYTVSLTVTDDDGLTDTAQAPATVVAGFTLTLEGEILDGRFLDGRRLSGTAQLRLYQADGTTPISLPGGLGPDENGVEVTDGDIDASLPVELTGTEVVVTVGASRSDLRTLTRGFAVQAGAMAHTERLTLVPAETAIRGRVEDTRGDPAPVDLGVARGDIAGLYELAGGRDYLPSSGIPASGVAHRTVVDPLGYYYLPIREGGRYFLDAVGDTGSATYLSTLLDLSVAAGAALDNDITVGLQAGGAGCDDLSGIPETPNVDYPTQIQPLWGFACTGCHKPNSANGGGLDLTEPGSLAALVNVPSTQVPGRALVAPGRPGESYLVEKIGCNNPQVGNRMRPGSPMVPAEQALVRDWIAQGALASSGPGPDAGVIDTGPLDTGATDSGAPPLDAGPPSPDAAPSDSGPAIDAGVSPDGGELPPGILRRNARDDAASGGCACLGPRPSDPVWSLLLLPLAGLALRPDEYRRRRRDRGSPSPEPRSSMRR